ncbi:MAG: HDOD domain-containing protein [Sulfurimonas sp.]|jgi:HD-like signal output (HDOD) protein/HPt (histidine-containing phosphotransfer) domain-containing protein
MIDKDSYEYEIYETFKDQFIHNMSQFKKNIFELQSVATYKIAVDNLFRIFHGIKANSRYFHFEAITIVADKVEKVLSSLREENGPAEINIINWLVKIEEQCAVWMEEMEDASTEFSYANPQLLDAVNIRVSDEKPSLIMKKISAIYLDANVKRTAQIVSELQKRFLKVEQSNALADFEKKLINEKPNVCLINFGDDCLKAAKLCQKHVPTSAIIVVLDASDNNTYLRLGVEGVYHIITNPIMLDVLNRELFTVTESHFTSRRYLITNQKIKKFIDTLQPLSASILQIQQVCNDDEMSIKELIKVVKHDPIISGMILKAARNPLYCLEEVNTVDRAISIFGKMRVQAIALSQMVDEFGKVDLSAYNIDESIFSNVATLRLTLMIKWYSKVSISSLSVLSTTAILGNIGELLIAQEITNLNKKNDFLKELNQKDVQRAEEKYMHTTTACVSSDILSYWQLDKDIVDSVRFSDYPQNAPEEIYTLCLANHIVYRLVKQNGEIEAVIPKKIETLLINSGLKTEPLQKALDAILEIVSKK